jgi:hypothetical protein
VKAGTVTTKVTVTQRASARAAAGLEKPERLKDVSSARTV